jgi:tetratricopeptide (TPR) repeat protein
MLRQTTMLCLALTAALLAGQAAGKDTFAVMLMKKADGVYASRATAGNGEAARQAYEKVLAVDANSVEARWKLGMTLYWLGTHEAKRERQMELFETGIRYCQEAVKIKDDCVQCHFWLAVSYGKYGEAKGVLQSLGLVPHMKDALEKARKLDDTYEWAGVYRVLGRLYFKLPAVSGGDNKLAEEYLRKAVRMSPEHLMNVRFLAELLLSVGKKDEAKEILKKIIDTPDDTLLKDKLPEMKEERDEARRIWTGEWNKYW